MNYNLIEQKLNEFDPRLLRLLYPRIYDIPGDFGSPKQAAIDLAACMFSVRRSSPMYVPRVDQDVALRNGVIAAESLIRYRVPTFFVSRDFFAAAMNSSPPVEFPITELRFPLPAMLLMLPRGAVVSPNNGPIDYLAVSYLQKSDQTLPSAFPDADGYRAADDVLLWFSKSRDFSWDGTFGGNAGGLEQGTLGDFFARSDEATFEPSWYEGGPHYAMPVDADDAAFLNSVMRIILKLVLAITARPDLIEPGRERKPAKREGDHVRPAFWTPNVIGRKYRVPSAQGSNHTGVSPRMHWRRGHYRNQPHGEHNQLRRLIWIDPMLIAKVDAAVTT